MQIGGFDRQHCMTKNLWCNATASSSNRLKGSRSPGTNGFLLTGRWFVTQFKLWPDLRWTTGINHRQMFSASLVNLWTLVWVGTAAWCSYAAMPRDSRGRTHVPKLPKKLPEGVMTGKATTTVTGTTTGQELWRILMWFQWFPLVPDGFWLASCISVNDSVNDVALRILDSVGWSSITCFFCEMWGSLSSLPKNSKDQALRISTVRAWLG